ncbi:MAG TPA: tetraacyldisaccharide 4'-kinase [Vicinamibacterales bacterium]|nr:tetraacyldisaccharide 4'-kinase [Vicinamibacterales bacterium]HPW21656.1 tetraacyldisaccharide 4'-kinase [Vicinamibacterales bacterium]
MLGALYAAAAARRRAWLRDGRQRRLRQPVVSVGNLRVGGTGKTPTAAYVAGLLADAGERPAVLSRGYARRTAPDGVVVVSDGERLLADLGRSGDEPLMLARTVRAARVVVSPDRYLAGRLAETRLGATVHVLDDGFQHVGLARGTDLLILDREDAADSRTLPAGRLREGLGAARFADALLVPGASEAEAASLAARLGVSTAFALVRSTGPHYRLGGGAGAAAGAAAGRVYAFAGIARPARFFAELGAAGWDVAGAEAFPDHHRYAARDVAALAAAARRAGAGALVTTEKDAVRLLPLRPLPAPVLVVPLAVRVEPACAFAEWLAARLAAERRAAGPAAGPAAAPPARPQAEGGGP